MLDAGAALHWLKQKSKAPADEGWSTASINDFAALKRKYEDGQNIGIRLGEFSKTPAGYIHVIDVDIRDPDQADDAWDAVRDLLLPNVDEMPMVVSGSGGESRHVYILTDKPMKNGKIAKSEGFSMVFDPKLGREVKKFDWEIDFFGTGKQVVVPPSIHPDTGQPYRWEREFDWAMLDLGIGPVVDTSFWSIATVEDEEDDDDDLFAIVRAEPIDVTDEQVDGYIADLPEDWVEDRENWLTVGAGLSHQYRGSQVGFEKWCAWSRQSDKFSLRDSKIVWRSFKGAKNPITFRSVIQAAQDNRLQSNLPSISVQEDEVDPLADLLGSGQLVVHVEQAPAKVNPIADWTSLLARNDEGAPTGCLNNAKLIVQNDVRTLGCIAYNEFKQDIVLVREPRLATRDREQVKKPMVQLEGVAWKVPDPMNGTDWEDTHQHQLRHMVEAPKGQGGYGIKISDRDLTAGLSIVADSNRYHPVRNYLDLCAASWDGKPRMDALFIDYLGSPDTLYHREAAALMLLGAVVRIYESGHKFDFVPILEGLQGKRKSTFVRVLGRNWSSELSGDFHDTKAMVEQILGSWIIEIPELQGFSKADTNVLKAWVSRTHDKTRLAYKKFAATYPRQCIFIGSTNEDEYLRDHTGGRRFWPIKCNLEDDIDTERLDRNMDMIWAEAVLRYREMRRTCRLKDLPLFLTSEEAKQEAVKLQESRLVDTAEASLAGQIEAWLDQPIGVETGFDDLDADAPKEYRDVTCALEVFTDMMGGDPGKYNSSEATRVGRAMARIKGWERVSNHVTTKRFGRQRVYRRVAALLSGKKSDKF